MEIEANFVKAFQRAKDTRLRSALLERIKANEGFQLVYIDYLVALIPQDSEVGGALESTTQVPARTGFISSSTSEVVPIHIIRSGIINVIHLALACEL